MCVCHAVGGKMIILQLQKPYQSVFQSQKAIQVQRNITQRKGRDMNETVMKIIMLGILLLLGAIIGWFVADITGGKHK